MCMDCDGPWSMWSRLPGLRPHETWKSGLKWAGTFCLFLSSLIVDVLCCSEPSPKEKGVVSSAFGILFLVSGLLASLILQDYYGPIRHFPHLFCRMILILPDMFPVCSTSFILILQTLLLVRVFLHMFLATIPQVSICSFVARDKNYVFKIIHISKC